MTSRSGLIIGLALVLIGLVGLITVGLLGAGGPNDLTCPGGGPCFGGRDDSAGSVDAMFIVGMVPHHEDAIEMAELALTRAEHPELKELARDIIDTQSAENDDMREWYRDWYGEDVPENGSFGMMGGDMGMGGMGSMGTDMSALESADPFDAEFIEQMIPHHQMGVMMARMVLARSAQPEIQELARSIITTQTAEIEQMQDWYREWYGR